jgi:hypothetical protein
MKHWLSAAAVLLAGVAFSSCTNAAVDKAVGSGAGAGIAVARTPSGISVTNNTGRPALEIIVNVDVDAPQPFFKQVPTLDTGQTVTLAFTDFRNEEGALFDPSAVTPKQIRMTGRDTLAQRYESTTPW